MPKKRPSRAKQETARRIAQLMQGERDGESLETDIGDEAQAVTVRSYTVRTLEAALETANVDLAVWEVERWIANKWDMGAKVEVDDQERLSVTELWQVKVWLRRRVAKTVADACNGLIERMRLHSPKYPKLPRIQKITDPHLLYIGLHDIHFGKLAWGAETGDNYDLKIAESIYHDAGVDLLRKAAGFPIERIVIPLGHDFLHIDNLNSSTTAGTPQDVDGRFAKIYGTGVAAIIRLIDYLIGFAPVDVLWVPGNHDYQSSYMAAKVVEAHYRHCQRVSVDASPKPRKRVHYGCCLIGATHGCDEKAAALPGIMAQEWPKEWSESLCREWLVGHHHRIRETHYNTGDTFDGVVVRVLPSLSGTDSWHHRKGFVGGRGKSAQALLYSKADGFCGQFSTNVWRPANA